MPKICVVEDENSIAEMVRFNLEMESYEVELIQDGAEALELFKRNFEFDLIILDVMLPNVSGVDLCRLIRQTSQVPILFLSAKGTTADRIEGLKAGGNDYLPKPFDLEELLLRIAILLNTIPKSTEEIVTIGSCEVNFKTFLVVNEETEDEITLSKKEVALLQLFYSKAGEVISRSEILDKVWGKDQFPTTRTIDNFILHFRKIFETNPKEPNHFHSVRGVGYKFLR
ncbi:MAG: response regulator transcription factor [Crocinitomicaceae bacterium]|jgi:two-component system alkaline phosphatase synthesis response regulator PhoP|nr:response regulator transcription factor [Crocinitomicaceae bacterium]MDC1384958.1 response regulator transcription factor [Crocinitomicaceae bacterium]|tara:strand:- start:72 stop:752 length:681 start_codon:yes stop_codon:yes gene_type:complete